MTKIRTTLAVVELRLMIRLILLLLAVFVSCISLLLEIPAMAQAGVQELSANLAYAIQPSATDPQITTFDSPHVAWLPQSKPRNQLLVFLPGTNGIPRANFPFALTAASLGYHVISLMYPDRVAAQQACPNSSDPDAYMKFRLAIIRGGQFDDLHVSPPDSIENRLTKLVLYLSRVQPDKGWKQFLDASGQVDWAKIVISGHSQGGGHAYVIAKSHQVARVIEFGSPKDYSFYFRRPASGFDSQTKTPLRRFFAFNHVEDTAGNCNHEMQMQIFQQIRLTDLGMVDVNGPTTDFHRAHLIFTDAPVPGMTSRIQFHTSVVNGMLQFDPQVWQYMLTAPLEE